MIKIEDLIKEIKQCKVCEPHLPLGANPILMASKNSKVAIIGQAPGTKVHKTGIPWNDQSGKLLREWMGVSSEQFYDTDIFAIVPMGFCYPGKGKSGDLPPRKECAPLWHEKLFDMMQSIELTLLIGSHSQKYYLGEDMKSNLTETVHSYEDYLPEYFPMPHPSPRNRIWLKKNSWFEEKNIPELKRLISKYFGK